MEKKENILKDIQRLIFPDQDDHLMIRDDHKSLIEKFLIHPVLKTARDLYNFIQKFNTFFINLYFIIGFG